MANDQTATDNLEAYRYCLLCPHKLLLDTGNLI